MDEYHHSQRTRFTSEQVKASVGKRAAFTLTGTIVAWAAHENGSFAMFQIDERFGFGPQVFGLDLELLNIEEE